MKEKLKKIISYLIIETENAMCAGDKVSDTRINKTVEEIKQLFLSSLLTEKEFLDCLCDSCHSCFEINCVRVIRQAKAIHEAQARRLK